MDYSPKDFWYTEILKHDEIHTVLAETFKVPYLWQNLAPLNGTLELQKLLPSLKADVYYVTQRPKSPGGSSLEQTSYWLESFNLLKANTSVIVVTDSKRKREIYKALDIKFSIDDREDTVRDLFYDPPVPDHQPFLLNQTWNKNYAKHEDDLPRVNSVTEFLEKVIEYQNSNIGTTAHSNS